MKTLVATAILLMIPASAMTQTAGSAPIRGEQSSTSLEQRVKELEERVILLEGQVRMLTEQAHASQAAPGSATAPVPSNVAGAQTGTGPATTVPSQVVQTPESAPGQGGTTLPVYGGATAAAKALNPDISMIGDFIGAAGHYPQAPGSVIRQAGFRSLEMHESEAGFQAIIDPYARGDFFLTFGEEGVGLEEGYITFTALPAGFVARAGKMRAAFGKVNTLHNHVLPWIDRPLVTENLLGGEDGIDDAGVSITRILPAPKGLFLEATGQVFRGDTGTQTYFTPGVGTIDQTLFTASSKGDVSTVAHLR